MSGPSNQGRKVNLNPLLSSIKLDIKSAVEFLRGQLIVQNDFDWKGYSMDLTNIPITNFKRRLLAKYPARSEDGSLLSFDPKEMADFGVELQKAFMEEMKRIMDLQQYSIRGILASRLMENKGSLHVNQIVKNYEENLQKYLEESDFGSDADVSKLHENLKARAISSLPNKEELGWSERKAEGLLLELTKVLESEIDKRKPAPEEVWRKKTEGIIANFRASHRECLEVANADSLEKAQKRFKEIAFILLKPNNPFPPNSEWKRKLEERVNEELENVLAEVRNRREKSMSKISGSEPIIPNNEVKEKIVTPPITGIEDEEGALLGGVSKSNSIPKVGAQQAPVDGVETVQVKPDSSGTARLEGTADAEDKEVGMGSLEPRDHELDIGSESREDFENQPGSLDESGAPPPIMRETKNRKREATSDSEAGESSLTTNRSRSPAEPREKRARPVVPI